MSDSDAAGVLQGRVALVSGAASGIGWATARLFAERGDSVVLADIDDQRLAARVREWPECLEPPLAFPLDVTRESPWTEVMARVLEIHSRLDILVNSAGIADEAPLRELRLEQWRRVMAVNLDGVFLGTSAAMRVMIPRGEGSIINVASVSGIKAMAGAAAYSASKAGVIQLTRVAARECAEAGSRVRVNAVVPGGVKTPMWESTPHWPAIAESAEWRAGPDAPAHERFAEPAEIAEAIAFLASPNASYIAGAALVLDGGASP